MITEVRGKGLFIGIELNEPARPYCEQLKAAGLLCKETHENVIRIAPPLVISEEDLEWAFQKIKSCIIVMIERLSDMLGQPLSFYIHLH